MDFKTIKVAEAFRILKVGAVRETVDTKKLAGSDRVPEGFAGLRLKR